MALQNDPMTSAQLTETLAGIDGAADLPVKIANYDGDHGMQVYSVRKHVVTDENDEITQAYIVING